MKKLFLLLSGVLALTEPSLANGPTVTTCRNLTDLAFCISGNGVTNKTYKFFAAVPGTNNYTVTWSAVGLPAGAILAPDGTLTMPVQDSDLGRVFSGITISYNDGISNQSKQISIRIRAPQTYFVDKNGSDSNPGTAASPWLTISHAVPSVLPGDTVVVAPGIYRERVATRGLVNGPDYLSFTTNGAGTVETMGFAIQNDYVSVNGFQITNANPLGANLPAVLIDGNFAKVLNNYIYNQYSRAYGVGGSWYDRPQYAYVASNHIYHCQDGMYTFGFNWIVEWNEIERLYQYDSVNDSDYFNIFGEGHIFRYNYLHGTIQGEVANAHVDCFQTYDDLNSLYWCARCTIEHNICSDFHEGFIGEAQLLLKSHDIIIRNNIFHDGLPLDANHPMGVKGVIVHDIPGVIVTNNTFYNITYGLAWASSVYGAATNGVVMNNIMVNTGYGYEFQTASGNVGDYNLVYPGGSSYNVGPHDLYNVDPQFVNPANALGPDGRCWTSDDGFLLQAGSRAITSGANGTQVGAYSALLERPLPPTGLVVVH
jgi:hypothetical protein